MGSGGRKGAARKYNRSKVPRLRWTSELHHSFVRAIDGLGGQDKATPKLILQLMDVRGLAISHVKSHLQMYRGTRHDIGKQEMQPQLHMKHSFAIDERGPKEFMCPPMKRANVGTEVAVTYKSMQGSSDMRTPGNQYCIDDYMQLQAMSMDKRVNEGLGWQRDTAAGARVAAAAANLQALGFWAQGPEPFKVHQVSKPKARHLNPVARQLSSKENYESGRFMFSSATRDEPGDLAKKCSPSLSLAIDQKAANAISSWRSESSCVLSPSSRSFSDCSRPPGCNFVGQRINLDLSLSLCGS